MFYVKIGQMNQNSCAGRLLRLFFIIKNIIALINYLVGLGLLFALPEKKLPLKSAPKSSHPKMVQLL